MNQAAATAPSLSPKRWQRRLLIFVAVLLLLPVLALASAGLWLWFGLPVYAGQYHLPGLRAGVEVMRDVNAVPHIFAAHEEDAAFALGFTHAQDRLWQMDVLRRTGQGRLSEIFGEPTLGYDRLMRSLGFYRAAADTFPKLSPEMQAVLKAYAAGVNQFLASNQRPLPPEFLLLGYKPEAWQPKDSLVWGYLMALQLSGNYRDELLRASLASRLSRDQLDDLYPAYPWDSPFTLDTASLAYLAQLAQGLPFLPKLADEGRGASNEFVLDGRFTQSGKPLLANDPHLSLDAPGLWYLARISSPAGTRIGATVPGVPAVVLGQGDHVAWGFTTTGADMQDVVLETVDPENPAHYMAGQDSVPFIVREEIIHLRGGGFEKLSVRETRHGPVISDLLSPALRVRDKTRVAALAFVPLREANTSIEAIWRAGQAKNADEFLAALEARYVAPMQNVVYADSTGMIGFIAPAKQPVRGAADGFMPADGRYGAAQWRGYIPFSLLPQARAPSQGLFYNANNAIVSLGYTYAISRDWEDPFRAERLRELLTALPQRLDFTPVTEPFVLEAGPNVPRALRGLMVDDSAQSSLVDSELSIPDLLLRLTAQSEAALAMPKAKAGPIQEAVLAARPDLLDATAAFNIMGDTVDVSARAFLPLLLAFVEESQDADVRKAAALLRNWDFTMRQDAPQPLIYTAWLRALNHALLQDEMGEGAFAQYFSWGLNARVLRRILTIRRGWCDDVGTAPKEDCQASVTKALQLAISDIEARLGGATLAGDMKDWRWGDLHVAPFAHALFSKLPVLRDVFSLAMPVDGGFYTLNRAAGDNGDGEAAYSSTHGAGYRAVYDLADRSQSRFLIAPGQSGNPLSPHYSDYLPRWRDNLGQNIWAEREALRTQNIGITTLWPADKL